MHLTSGKYSFPRLLNPDRSIKFQAHQPYVRYCIRALADGSPLNHPGDGAVTFPHFPIIPPLLPSSLPAYDLTESSKETFHILRGNMQLILCPNNSFDHHCFSVEGRFFISARRFSARCVTRQHLRKVLQESREL